MIMLVTINDVNTNDNQGFKVKPKRFVRDLYDISVVIQLYDD